MRKISLSALTLVAVLSVGGAAQADCCSDVWSCLGAVATLGASCQMQSLIESITTLKTAVESMSSNLSAQAASLMTQAQQGVNSAAADLKQVRLDAGNDLKNSADQSRAIAHAPPPTTTMMKPGTAVAKQNVPAAVAAAPQPVAGSMVMKGAVAAPPKPADAAAVKDAFNRADVMVQGLFTQSTNPQNQVNQAADQAVQAAVRHLNTARQISTDAMLTPLKMLADSLLDLLTHPERLFDPTAQINADITRISQQMPAMFDRISNEVTQEALADLNQGTAALTQIQDSAASAHGVVEAMQKLNAERTQANLDALNVLLPRSGMVMVSPTPGAPPAPPTQMLALSPSITLAHKQRIGLALDRANPQKLPIVVQQHAAAAGLASKWQSIRLQMKTPVAVAPASQQKVDKDLAGMYAGKKGAEIQKKKEELFVEAQKRFGKDPKTLAKVKAYIEAHTPKG